MNYEQAKELINKYGSRWAEHIAEPAPASPTVFVPRTIYARALSARGKQPLTNDDLRRRAPSVFALEPWQAMSDKYRFIPTINVINSLRDSGFYPVSAQQSRSRIPGKGEFTKHMLRFRRNSDLLQVGDIIPEIGIINSHDGTSAYKLFLGLYRCICSNQMTVSDTELMSIRVTHRGERDLCQNIIDVSFKVINDAPRALDRVNAWRGITLDAPRQLSYAGDALKLYDSALEVKPERILSCRRRDDMPDGRGARSLWATYNVVQENFIRGGIVARNTQGRIHRTHKITSIDRDVKINRGLWALTEQFANN